MANAQAFEMGWNAADKRFGDRHARKEQLEDEDRRRRVSEYHSQLAQIPVGVSLGRITNQQGESLATDIHSKLDDIYRHPIHGPSRLHKDWNFLHALITRKQQPTAAPVLSKTTEPGTPAEKVTLPSDPITFPQTSVDVYGRTKHGAPLERDVPFNLPSTLATSGDVTLAATPAAQTGTVAMKPAVMTAQQREGMKRREQAKQEAQLTMLDAPLTPEETARVADATKSAEVESAMRRYDHFYPDASSEDRNRHRALVLESVEGIKSASLTGKWQTRSGKMNGQPVTLMFNEKDGRLTYMDGSPVPQELALNFHPDAAKPVKKIRLGVVASPQSQTKFAELWGDPYEPADKSKWSWTEIGPTRYQQTITSTGYQKDAYGVLTTSGRTIGPANTNAMDLSGIQHGGEGGEQAAPAQQDTPVAAPKATPAAAPEAASDPTTETMAIPVAKIRGLVAPGNIPIWGRPIIQNADGNHSSELSFSFIDEDKNSPYYGKEVLVPSIVNGRFLTPDGKIPPLGKMVLNPQTKQQVYQPTPQQKAMYDLAKEHYYDTKEQLGVFDNWQNADAYAKVLHNRKQKPIPPVATKGATPKASATPATPQGLRAQVPSPPAAASPVKGVDALHHPDGPGAYGAPRVPDPATDHIPVDAPDPKTGHPFNRGLVEGANQLLDGMDIKEVSLPAKDKAFAMEIARLYGWGRGPYTPRELKQMQNADQFLDMVLASKKFMRLLDSGMWTRTKASIAEKDASKLGTLDTIVHQWMVTGSSPEQQEYVRLRQSMMGTISGLSSVVRSGRATESTINRLAQEIPDVLASANSQDAHERVANIKKEIALAMRQGVPAPTKRQSDQQSQQVQQIQQKLRPQSQPEVIVSRGTKTYKYNGSGNPEDWNNYTEVKPQ